MIQHEIFRLVSRFPIYISYYIAENRFPLGQCKACVHKVHTRFKTHFSDFRENFRDYSSWAQKFKTIGIFSISFSLPKYEIFVFFNSVRILMKKFCHFLQCKAKTPMNSTLFEFSWYLLLFLRYERFHFHFLINNALHNVLKIWRPKKALSTKNNLKILSLKII